MPIVNKGAIRRFFRTYVISFDTIISLLVSVCLYVFLPTCLKSTFTESFYNIGITVLSIVFSLFFAALAIIMSSTDNEFIMFLEEDGLFSELMKTFKVVLIMLFMSLIYSIVLYTTTDFLVKNNGENVMSHKIWFIIFQFLFTYSLLSTALSIKDTITFTHHRTEFLMTKKKQ